MGADAFDRGFAELTGYHPFRWQRRLFEEHFLSGRLPPALDLPTGLGKTSVMAIWYLARKAGAAVPRRLAYVVDRRAVVDQATTVADGIKARSGDGSLSVSTLRGRHVDNREWLTDPVAAAIVVGTVDMIGSRLLFSGYGVSRRMRPYHAGLLGSDTLVMLDESHLVPPFERLLDAVATDGALRARDETDRELFPSLRLLPLSATGRSRDNAFRLQAEDWDDPVVRQRLNARKRVAEVPLDGRKLEAALAEEALALAEGAEAPIRCLVYCNSPGAARVVRREIDRLSKGAATTQLLVGSRRVYERATAEEKLRELGFLAGDGRRLEQHTFLIATSAGEVGVDLDADHLVCDLVPFERMIQRLGRVNRRGEGDALVRVVSAADPTLPQALGKAAELWQELSKALPDDEGGRDVSPGALHRLKQRSQTEAALEAVIRSATTPEPLYPELTRPLLDAWSMTSLEEHAGRPEVAPWLRGWVEEEPQTIVVWRTHLPLRTTGEPATMTEVEAFFEAAPPHLSEKLEARTSRVVDWLMARAKALVKVTNARKGNGGSLFSEGSIVGILLETDGTPSKGRDLTLGWLTDEGSKARTKAQLFRLLTAKILVLDARLAGLEEGLLSDSESNPPVTLDGEGFSNAEAAGGPAAGFRVRVCLPQSYVLDENWHKPFFFDLERNDEDEPERQLVVEKWRQAATREEERAVARREQLLAEHQDWTARRARALAESLRLRSDLTEALAVAAALHDEGKRAARWQRAFNAPKGEDPYAKTRGPIRFAELAGYRHEFGSLFYVESDDAFGELTDDLKELALHLVAAHHGRARPVIEIQGCEQAPPSVLEKQAREVALRFVRLQKRWGPWGLAWLEALLRAADQQASSDNDAGRPLDG